ncbi:MAG: deaminase [Herpetosiphonaceae bacterium]|nr:MAG: deaminase [Herpetosiphonaceae bacterium]
MGKVMVGLAMSLDGFIAGPNDGPENPLGDGGEHLFKWYSSGDVDFTWPSGTMMSKVSAESAALLREMVPTIGSLVTGRRTFDIARAWGGRHPLDVPVVVLTHTIPQEWAGKESVFTFVSDGIESAVARAKTIAGHKNVAVSAASIVQQCLRAGLLDEIHINLVPVLLGRGVRLFDHLGIEPIELERTRVIEAPGVTHLTFRVVK